MEQVDLQLSSGPASARETLLAGAVAAGQLDGPGFAETLDAIRSREPGDASRTKDTGDAADPGVKADEAETIYAGDNMTQSQSPNVKTTGKEQPNPWGKGGQDKKEVEGSRKTETKSTILLAGKVIRKTKLSVKGKGRQLKRGAVAGSNSGENRPAGALQRTVKPATPAGAQLGARLSEKGVSFDNLTVALKPADGLSAKLMEEAQSEISGIQDTKKESDLNEIVEKLLQDVQLPHQGRQIESFRLKLQASLTTGKPLQFDFQVDNMMQAGRLQQQTRSLLETLKRHGIKTGKITISVKKGAAASRADEKISLERGKAGESRSPGRDKVQPDGPTGSRKEDNVGIQPDGSRFENLPAVSSKHFPGGGGPTVDLQAAAGGGKVVTAAEFQAADLNTTIQKIARLAEQQLTLSSRKLEVSIDLKEVGRVTVDALRHLDKIHLQVQVESNDIRRLLENQLRPILEQLAKEGLDIGKLDVSVRDQRSGGHHGQDLAEQKHRNQTELFAERDSSLKAEKSVRPTRQMMRRSYLHNPEGRLETWA